MYYMVCVCVCEKNMKLYIFNIYTYILYTLNVSVFVQCWRVHFPSDSLIIQTHITLCFFSALQRVKNKFAKLFLFVFIISVLYNTYIYHLFSVFFHPHYPLTPPTPILPHYYFMSFLKLETKVDARLIYYNPPDCHPTALQRTSGVKILPYYLYTINVYAHIHTILHTHTYTHTWKYWTTDTVILHILHDICRYNVLPRCIVWMMYTSW